MRLLLALLLILAAPAARAESATVAVASNFAPTAERLADDYAEASGHEVTVIAGATGKLFAQITQGAPIDAFLSADQATAARLADEGVGLADTQITYAEGQLVLWSADPARDLSDPDKALRSAAHIAIANPDLAPYGRAAEETIAALGLTGALADRIVTAENVGQAQSFVATGAADLGFVPAPGRDAAPGGTSWLVPGNLHAPLLQDAILLERGRDNAAAKGFLAYLQTEPGRARIAAAGYELP